jgi:hypothetical protein
VGSDKDAYSGLVGEELSGVVFVRDYVQLQFDGVTLNALTPIRVRAGLCSAGFGEESFANLLIAQIGKRVVHAAANPGHSVDIQLSDGSSMAVSLRPEDYVGPEAVNLRGRDGSLVVL